MSNWIYFVLKYAFLYYASVSVFLSSYVCLSFPECEFSSTDHFADPSEYPNHCSCSVTNLWVDPCELHHARLPCTSLSPQPCLPWNTNIWVMSITHCKAIQFSWNFSKVRLSKNVLELCGWWGLLCFGIVWLMGICSLQFSMKIFTIGIYSLLQISFPIYVSVQFYLCSF